MPKKPLAVVRIVRLAGASPRVGLVPWCVRPGGRTTKFRGLPCERTVVLTAKTFASRGLAVLLDLLGRAPLAIDDPLDGHTTRATDDVFDLDMPAATAMAFVTQGPSGPALGRIEVRPAKALYRSGEVLRFTDRAGRVRPRDGPALAAMTIR